MRLCLFSQFCFSRLLAYWCSIINVVLCGRPNCGFCLSIRLSVRPSERPVHASNSTTKMFREIKVGVNVSCGTKVKGQGDGCIIFGHCVNVCFS